MKVVYISHSGFYIELKRHAFLIDYYKGKIPDIPEEKELYVLVSHVHGDHYNPDIFGLSDSRQVKFVLSSDIAVNRPGDEICFLEPDVVKEFGNTQDLVRIHTLKSTDEGAAFDITCEGVRFYHAGDLNWWHWDEEGEEWNTWVEKAYQEEIDKLADSVKDGELPFTAAFLPLDPRQGEAFYLGFDYFMKQVGAAYAFPMHFWKQPEITKRLRELSESLPYRDRIQTVETEGQVFYLQEGKDLSRSGWEY